ncbi:MAG: hypothetical protein JXR37_21860 [Kiritimatiellae bacterium]|nr:hypothetical protein [Kiritimatiellia bacterium]
MYSLECASDGSSDLQRRWRELLQYWFVRYNPLYFFSALCVLGGVFLMSRGIDLAGVAHGPLMLAGVMEVYQFLILAGAALLYWRTPQKRPAVILGVMQVFFLFDCTFQTEALGACGLPGAMASAVWALLFGVKLFALILIFGLVPSGPAFFLPLLAGLGVAAAPHLLSLPLVDKGAVHLALMWLGVGLLTVWRLAKPKVQPRDPLDDWGTIVLRRAVNGAWSMWGLFYLIHLVAWVLQFNIALTRAHAVSLVILAAVFARRERWVWAGAMATVLFGLLYPSSLFCATAGLVAAVLAAQAWALRNGRLWVGAALALHLAGWTVGWAGGPLACPPLWLTVATMTVLLGLAVWWRKWFPFCCACLVVLPSVLKFLPRNVFEWGIAVTFLGFIALVVGVAINWDLRRSQ